MKKVLLKIGLSVIYCFVFVAPIFGQRSDYSGRHNTDESEIGWGGIIIVGLLLVGFLVFYLVGTIQERLKNREKYNQPNRQLTTNEEIMEKIRRAEVEGKQGTVSCLTIVITFILAIVYLLCCENR